MTVLITGGTGKTGTKLIPYLAKAQTPYLIASRTPPSSSTLPYVKFDFTDASTYSNPFDAANLPIEAIYIVVPLQSPNAVKVTNDFVDFAVKEKGVRRFVLLASSTTVKGGPMHGAVWEHISSLEGAEITVLQPTWFLGKFCHDLGKCLKKYRLKSGVGLKLIRVVPIENLSSWIHSKSIKDEGKIYSAAEDGQAPWVAVEDISRVAFHALTSSTPLTETLTILGPRLYTIDVIAATMTRVLGHQIAHVRLSPQERIQWIVDNLGFPEQGAMYLTSLETGCRDGAHGYENDVVESITGVKPMDLGTWLEQNRDAWE